MIFVVAILDLTLKMILKSCFDIGNVFVTSQNLMIEASHKSVVKCYVNMNFLDFCGGHIGFYLEDDPKIIFSCQKWICHQKTY